MKKIAIIFAFALLLGTSLSSCRSSKPPCPAYQAVNIELNDTHILAK
ncbi:MAG: hypothetical protein JXL97_00350 [Bacteroidales bacterium]|nr:hypothetical protein [Bacteroidales bacterium]